MSFFNNNTDFPTQKKATSAKDKVWRKKCVDAGEAAALWKDEGLRASLRNKKINYDLYSDILDQADVEKICNPMGVMGLSSPAKMQNYPICNPKIDLLVGESLRRKLDWKVRVVNEDAISAKEDDMKRQLSELILTHIQKEDVSKERMEEELKKFQNYMSFEYQDARERVATQILSYLTKHLQLEHLFSKGFKDALIAAEEIYQCDIIGGEPVVRRLNPLNVNIVKSGESNLIEDADLITIVGYMSPGQIIDDYHDELTPAEIDRIERGLSELTSASNGINIGRKPDLALNSSDAMDLTILSGDFAYGSPLDNNGNIRVTKVLWKSLRKLKKVKYYDEEGDEQYELYDENYKIDKTKGEEETILWVSEWWEGHKIGGNVGDTDSGAIYLRMRPKPVQFRSLENPSKCHPGIVGTIYNTNDNVGISLMDRMKPYQYLYNVLAYNTELAIAKNYGKIMRMDLASIPENWQIDQWLSFAQGMNVAFYDSFKEGNKGAAQGKIAGTMTAQSPVIDMEMGNTIQLYMSMMGYIKQELGEIAGVSAARQGQIQNRQAVGNVQQEITQTSHITEYWFAEHEQVKLRVLNCLLETAKFAWKDKHNKKVQYVLDDGATLMFDVNGPIFNESEYGLQIVDGASTYEFMQTMKQLAHAGFQSGMVNFSQVLDILSTESMAATKRKITRAEEEKVKEVNKQREEDAKLQREKMQLDLIEKEKERDFKREEWDRVDSREDKKLLNTLEVERLRQDNVESKFATTPDNGGKERISLEQLRLQAQTIANNTAIKMKELEETKRSNKANEELEAAKIAKMNKGNNTSK